MIELSIAIQHTPSRADRRKWVQAMLNQLRIENPNIPIALIEDTQHEGCWPTYRRTLEAASEVSHHLVLQDDLGLCKDFIQSVKEVIRARPNNTATAWQEFSTSSNFWGQEWPGIRYQRSKNTVKPLCLNRVATGSTASRSRQL